MALRRLGRGVFAGGLAALMCSQAPRITAQVPAHLWHADYNMEWVGPRSSGDQILDGAYAFKYTWRFGILNDPNGVLDSPTITVVPNPASGVLTPMQPGNVALNPSFPPYVWTGPQLAPQGQPGISGFFTQLNSNLSVGSLYQLGFDATRNLPGGPIAAGATETRSFTLTMTPRDATLMQLGATINFALEPQPGQPVFQGPITASNLVCTSPSGRVEPFGNGPAVSWHLGDQFIQSAMLQQGTTYTLSCSVTLANGSMSPAVIAPNVVLGGKRSQTPTEINSTSRNLTTDPSTDPWDPLGYVQFDVTASGDMRAVLDRHFSRMAFFNEYNHILDIVPPVTTAATQPPSPNGTNGWFRVQTVGVSLTANDGNGSGVKSITYSLSGAQNQGPTTVNGSVTNTNISAAGVTTVTFFATDNAGNVEEPKSITVRRDSNTPTSTVTPSPAPNANGWNNGPVTVTVDGTDATSGVAQICLTLFGSTVQPQTCSPGTSASVVVTAAGNTNVSYFAIDAAGNAEGPRSVNVQIDTTAPVTNASAPTNPQGWITATGPVAVSLNSGDAPPSPFSGVSLIHYSINGVEQPAIAGLSGSVPVTAEGTTTIGYWAEDRAGNFEAPKSITVKRDSIRPVSAATRTPAPNANGWNNAPVTVTVDATDATSGVGKVCLQLFGATTQPQNCTTGSSASVQVTAAGNTNVSYFAVDAAGNAEAPRSVNVQIDNLAPATNALFPQANPQGWYTNNLTISLTASDTASPGFSGVTKIHYSLNGVEQAPIMGLGGPFTIFSEGTTQVHYWAEDRAGNLELPKTFTVNIDKTLPNIFVAPSLATTEGAVFAIPFTVSGQNGETVTFDCSLSSGTGVVVFSSGGCSYSAADGLASGVVRIRAEDGHGNFRTVFTTIAVNNVAPAITGVTGPEGPVRLGTSATVSAAYTDPGAPETFTCTFNWQDGSAPESVAGGPNGCVASHSYAVAGVYSVDVTVTDGDGGADTETFDYVVVYSPDAGSVTGGGSINGSDRGNLGFNAKYHGDELKGQTQFQVKDANLSFNSSAYDWLVVSGGIAVYEGRGTVNGGGDFGFRVTVTDSKVSGSGADTFRIQIWDRTTETLTYDSEPGADDFALPTRQLATGNIAIHK